MQSDKETVSRIHKEPLPKKKKKRQPKTREQSKRKWAKDWKRHSHTHTYTQKYTNILNLIIRKIITRGTMKCPYSSIRIANVFKQTIANVSEALGQSELISTAGENKWIPTH